MGAIETTVSAGVIFCVLNYCGEDSLPSKRRERSSREKKGLFVNLEYKKFAYCFLVNVGHIQFKIQLFTVNCVNVMNTFWELGSFVKMKYE